MSKNRNGMIKDPDGNCIWYQNNQRHREDGPAYEHTNGYRAWYRNGKRHREDGPAVEWSNGNRTWWLNDIRYTEEEYKQELRIRKWGLSVDA